MSLHFYSRSLKISVAYLLMTGTILLSSAQEEPKPGARLEVPSLTQLAQDLSGFSDTVVPGSASTVVLFTAALGFNPYLAALDTNYNIVFCVYPAYPDPTTGFPSWAAFLDKKGDHLESSFSIKNKTYFIRDFSGRVMISDSQALESSVKTPEKCTESDADIILSIYPASAMNGLSFKDYMDKYGFAGKDSSELPVNSFLFNTAAAVVGQTDMLANEISFSPEGVKLKTGFHPKKNSSLENMMKNAFIADSKDLPPLFDDVQAVQASANLPALSSELVAALKAESSLFASKNGSESKILNETLIAAVESGASKFSISGAVDGKSFSSLRVRLHCAKEQSLAFRQKIAAIDGISKSAHEGFFQIYSKGEGEKTKRLFVLSSDDSITFVFGKDGEEEAFAAASVTSKTSPGTLPERTFLHIKTTGDDPGTISASSSPEGKLLLNCMLPPGTVKGMLPTKLISKPEKKKKKQQ